MFIQTEEKKIHEVCFRVQNENESPQMISFDFIGTNSSFAEFVQNLWKKLKKNHCYSELMETKISPPDGRLLFGYW